MSMTDYYVDPAIAANSGAGTIGDPYGDLQYALDSITRDATNGDRLNVKAGTAEVLAATLSFATYGTPSLTAGITIAGYTATKGDGGVCEIDGGGGTIFNATGEGVHFVDCHLTNGGASDLMVMDRFSSIRRCKLSNTTGDGIAGGDEEVVIDSCWFDDIGGAGVSAYVYSITNCLFTDGATRQFNAGAIHLLNGSLVLIHDCCFLLTGSAAGIFCNTTPSLSVISNSFFTSGSGKAITGLRPIRLQAVCNNLFEGWGDGLELSTTAEPVTGPITHNSFFDCTDTYDVGENDLFNTDNETLGATPFAKSGSISSFVDRLTYFAPQNVGSVLSGISGKARGAVGATSSGGGGGALVNGGLVS